MATTSVRVTLINNTDYSLTKIDDNLEGATWVVMAPDTIGPNTQTTWQCEAGGPLGDTKGWVAYRVGDTEQAVVRWDNPSLGDAAYRIDMSDNSPLDANVEGIIGDAAAVTYTLTPLAQQTADDANLAASTGTVSDVATDEGMIADASFAAGGAPGFDEAAVGAAMDAEYTDDAEMDQYEESEVAAAGDMPADTPTRSVKIYFTNDTDLTLLKQETGMIQGTWVLLPLDIVLPRATVEWQCASEGVQSGTEGYVIYTADGDNAPLFNLHWNNPYVDVPAYTGELSEGYHLEVSSSGGDYAEVSYTLQSLKAAA